MRVLAFRKRLISFSGKETLIMKKPLIGITPAHNTETGDLTQRPTYPRAVAAAGGLPLHLPLEPSEEDADRLAQLCDGLLLSGGPDPHPFLYGEEALAFCRNVSPLRDASELALLKAFMARRKPVLGICRGVQLINAGLGGSLWQDIPSQVTAPSPLAHQQPFSYATPSHHVRLEEGSLLWRLSGKRERLAVNSMHHQAVRTPAPGLTACAWAEDGVIEALEMPGYPFLLGVQWHPEYLREKDEAAAALFSAFVEACRGA